MTKLERNIKLSLTSVMLAKASLKLAPSFIVHHITLFVESSLAYVVIVFVL